MAITAMTQLATIWKDRNIQQTKVYVVRTLVYVDRKPGCLKPLTGTELTLVNYGIGVTRIFWTEHRTNTNLI